MLRHFSVCTSLFRKYFLLVVGGSSTYCLFLYDKKCLWFWTLISKYYIDMVAMLEGYCRTT